jgi:hypothetical protein
MKPPTLQANRFVCRYGFTGQEVDDNIGTVNLNGRMLLPSGGRMMSPDPYVPHPGNTQSFQ